MSFYNSISATKYINGASDKLFWFVNFYVTLPNVIKRQVTLYLKDMIIIKNLGSFFTAL
jgi:hypothetical protein